MTKWLRAQREFARRHCLLLPGFLAPPLLEWVQARLSETRMYERTHEGVGLEFCAEPGPVTGLLELIANDPVLLGAVRQLTACSPIGCFSGRMYRLDPGGRTYDSWYGDLSLRTD